jgi:16S rRNA (guanine527-N7)-methyltransferase
MCTSSQKLALEAHYELMLRWNAKLNLTRITDREEAWERHYKESIFLAHKLPPGPLKIADVGSGAGFPGIPIAVLRPECTVTLIESHQRKAVFLREATRGLPNVRVLAMRAEAVTETFDWIVSRAVSPKEVLKLKFAPNIALLTGRCEISVPRGTLSS